MLTIAGRTGGVFWRGGPVFWRGGPVFWRGGPVFWRGGPRQELENRVQMARERVVNGDVAVWLVPCDALAAVSVTL